MLVMTMILYPDQSVAQGVVELTSQADPGVEKMLTERPPCSFNIEQSCTSKSEAGTVDPPNQRLSTAARHLIPGCTFYQNA